MNFLIAVVFRSGRLRRAYRIGRRKAVDQTCLEPRVDVAVRHGGFARIDGVLVVRRGIEFLNHVEPPLPEVTLLISRSSTHLLGRTGTDVYQKTTICCYASGTDA